MDMGMSRGQGGSGGFLAGKLPGLVVFGSIVHMGGGHRDLVVWGEYALPHSGHDEFEVPETS